MCRLPPARRDTSLECSPNSWAGSRCQAGNFFVWQLIDKGSAMLTLFPGEIFAIPSSNGPIDFKNTFKGQADPELLGSAGNFAYYAIGSGNIPARSLTSEQELTP